MKNLGYIAGEITKGKNLSENLLKYGNGMCSMYNGLGFIKMSMNYYTVLDIARDLQNDKDLLNMINRLNELVERFVENDECDDYEAFNEINSFREQIIEIMEVITAYVDRLRIYEHVLNRVEYRFNEGELDYDYYNTYMTNEIMHYILSDKDNVVINGKISEIVGQLPVRMLKDRFFEHIRDAFTLYHGAGKDSIDDFYYTLSTSAMLSGEAGFDKFPDVYDIYNTLAGADYRNIDKDEYVRLKGALDIATEKMTDYADVYVLLTQVVNDALTVVLTRRNTLDRIEEIENAKNVLSKTRNAYVTGERFEDISEDFAAFEGKQERILEAVSSGDYAIEYSLANFVDELKEYELLSAYNALSKTLKLQSGSDFVKLESEVFAEIPDNSYADETAEKLIMELDDSFKNMNVMVKRAVMASVLSSLPVFFNNTEEIQAYINNSLMQCNDDAEQKAVVEIIKTMISDN